MNGYLVIGDVHARFEPFYNAVKYAALNDLQLVSVGDLNDQNDQGPEVFALMRERMEAGLAVGVIGNHEWKIARWRKGNPVKISGGNKITAEQIEANEQFGKDFDAVVAGMENVLELPGGVVVAHAAVHPGWWNNTVSAKRAQEMFFYGETSGDQVWIEGRQYPDRTYEWSNQVPQGRTVIVGHDTRAMMNQVNDQGGFNPPRDVPHFYDNPQGGHVIFVDTGCGKSGTLSGVHLDANGEFVGIDNFGG
jgi:hypothetical protein